MLSNALRELAATPDRFALLSGDVERYADERVCVLQGAVWANVSGIRVGEDDVASLLAEVRSLVPPAKRITWWLDPDVRPADLPDRLRALGLREPVDRVRLLHALACTTPPPAGPPGVEVRPVRTLEEHVTAAEVMWEAFDTPAERRAEARPHLGREFEEARRAGTPASFLAFLDGRPVGVGRSVYSDRGAFLIGGSVAPPARGRGVYRALVRARWDDAAARGTPALVVSAMRDTSYPILTRLGFEEVCVIRRLEDPRTV